MSKFKVYYTDYNYQNKSIEQKIFDDAGIEVIFADKSLGRKELIEFCKDADGLITTYTVLDEEFFSQTPNCKIAVRSGIGYNNIDVEAATKRNIMVANVRDYCVEDVADHAVALTLTLIRKIPHIIDCVKNKHSWTVNDCRPILRISSLNICLYGLGAIGKDYAKKLQAFGTKVYAYDPFVSDEEFAKLGITKVDTVVELAKLADIFSIHTPLTDETEKSVN
ncbi:MAG: hypothetical protein LBR30_05145, partial [Clostridioides sp.]|nr:hypothetical protein [Clostridioides sp.]